LGSAPPVFALRVASGNRGWRSAERTASYAFGGSLLGAASNAVCRHPPSERIASVAKARGNIPGDGPLWFLNGVPGSQRRIQLKWIVLFHNSMETTDYQNWATGHVIYSDPVHLSAHLEKPINIHSKVGCCGKMPESLAA
jgi:hypothetical protein